eukprot:scaffold2659_cov107-Cylindrotheca_fusiformis.AAC.11
MTAKHSIPSPVAKERPRTSSSIRKNGNQFLDISNEDNSSTAESSGDSLASLRQSPTAKAVPSLRLSSQELRTSLEQFESLTLLENVDIADEEESVDTFRKLVDYYETPRHDLLSSLRAFQAQIDVKLAQKPPVAMKPTTTPRKRASKKKKSKSMLAAATPEDSEPTKRQPIVPPPEVVIPSASTVNHKVPGATKYRIKSPEMFVRVTSSSPTTACSSSSPSSQPPPPPPFASASPMTTKEIRKELQSYGVSTEGVLEKSELVRALTKARSERMKTKTTSPSSSTARKRTSLSPRQQRLTSSDPNKPSPIDSPIVKPTRERRKGGKKEPARQHSFSRPAYKRSSSDKIVSLKQQHQGEESLRRSNSEKNFSPKAKKERGSCGVSSSKRISKFTVGDRVLYKSFSGAVGEATILKVEFNSDNQPVYQVRLEASGKTKETDDEHLVYLPSSSPIKKKKKAPRRPSQKDCQPSSAYDLTNFNSDFTGLSLEPKKKKRTSGCSESSGAQSVSSKNESGKPSKGMKKFMKGVSVRKLTTSRKPVEAMDGSIAL